MGWYVDLVTSWLSGVQVSQLDPDVQNGRMNSEPMHRNQAEVTWVFGNYYETKLTTKSI